MRIAISLLLIAATKFSFGQDSLNKRYFSNGQVASYQIKKDSVNIYEEDFYESGKLKGEGIGIIINGKYKPKQFKTYYKSGKLETSLCDTLYCEFEETGEIILHVQMKDWRNNGEFRVYRNGKLSLLIEYTDGKKNGVSKIYDFQTGRKVIEDHFKDGLQVGTSKHFDGGGNLTKEIYRADHCIIKVIYYSKNRRPIKIITDKSELILKEGRSIDCD